MQSAISEKSSLRRNFTEIEIEMNEEDLRIDEHNNITH